MNTDNGIPEKGSLLDDINEFGKLINDFAVSLGHEPTCKPITLDPITTRVAKMKNLLAEIDLPINYAGVHWLLLSVYGDVSKSEGLVTNMRFEIDGTSAEWLPESLKQQITSEILAGDFS